MAIAALNVSVRGVLDSVMPQASAKVSDQLESWLTSDGDKTLGGLVEVFGEKSFAILFVLLLGLPALPLPTGGATHAFEVIAVLLVGAAGILLTLFLGAAAIDGLKRLF